MILVINGFHPPWSLVIFRKYQPGREFLVSFSPKPEPMGRMLNFECSILDREKESESRRGEKLLWNVAAASRRWRMGGERDAHGSRFVCF